MVGPFSLHVEVRENGIGGKKNFFAHRVLPTFFIFSVIKSAIVSIRSCPNPSRRGPNPNDARAGDLTLMIIEGDLNLQLWPFYFGVLFLRWKKRKQTGNNFCNFRTFTLQSPRKFNSREKKRKPIIIMWCLKRNFVGSNHVTSAVCNDRFTWCSIFLK